MAGVGAPPRPDEWAGRCAAIGIDAVTRARPAYPAVLRHDPQPPAVLFVRGDLAVARRAGASASSAPATPPAPGATSPSSSGCELAAAGVAVVSGLAKGIDGAAHRGVLGVDGGATGRRGRQRARRAYPRVQRRRCGPRSARAGVLLSEWPPGTAPEPFRFPLRNRILAALERGARGRREPRAGRLADHGAGGARAIAST